MSSKDQIYQTSGEAPRAKRGSFAFDERVANVFEDMISRSVPGYQQILEMLPTLTRQCQRTQAADIQANYYDLGCSLGAGMLAMEQGLNSTLKNSRIIGVDNSAAMIHQAKENLESPESQNIQTKLIQQDLLDSKISSAMMVLMNFTLQFIALEHRDHLIQRIYDGLHTGGYLVLSEKIMFDNDATNQALIDIHHQFKADQGYSELEIAQKRDAIENVLIPETLEAHIQRLKKAGFSIITPWVQNLQFISVLAIK